MLTIEETLKNLPAEERLREQKKQIEPLVEVFFTWAKDEFLKEVLKRCGAVDQ